MPSQDQLLDAAATIAVVVAAHLRQSQAGRRRARNVDARLDHCARELAKLRDHVERWTGLP